MGKGRGVASLPLVSAAVVGGADVVAFELTVEPKQSRRAATTPHIGNQRWGYKLSQPKQPTCGHGANEYATELLIVVVEEVYPLVAVILESSESQHCAAAPDLQCLTLAGLQSASCKGAMIEVGGDRVFS